MCLVPEYDGGVAVNSVEGREWGGAAGRQAGTVDSLVQVGATSLGSGGGAFNSTSCTNKARW